MPNNSMRPIHAGEILREEFLKPLGLSVATLAEFLGIVPDHVHDIISGRCGIIADTALRLAQYFGNSPRFWLELQNTYERQLTKTAHFK
ncbi:addiction module antidote protein, HigA family [Moraxella caviae]|uniref:Addiction module antidote protein, HigA family n=1 Tax=Moraxella caviae TaxID=34060 RepID=A0A1S9ZYY1_9GAMM|nr:HigA family addiction module antitoxin [Moraxella caviae]OOR88617.1 addiction module antidote protein, HigA family [Moraxella caviae]STZ13701.1 Antitoxin HigA-1 [Moraxella caviae]